MEARVWHKAYDPGVPSSLKYPAIPVWQLLVDTAARCPDWTALVFLGKEMSYRELGEKVDRCARGLADLGVKKGDRVALYLPNTPHMVIAYYGVLRAGGIVVGTNPLYTERELSHQVKDSGAEVLVTLDLKLTLEKVEAIRASTKLRKVIVGSVADYLPFPKSLLYPLVKRKDLYPIPKDSAYVKWTQFLAGAEPNPPQVPVDVEDVAVLMYTGGTTGVSKGAMLTHRNLIANAVMIYAWATSGKMDDKQQETTLVVLPLFHSFAMTVAMNTGIFRATKQILFPTRPKPDMSDLLQVIKKYRPTILPGVPTLYTALANRPEATQYGIDSIKVCVSGAAPLPLEVMERFEKATGAKILEGYGLSESSPVAACNPMQGKRKAGGIGVPMPDTEIKIMDADTGSKEVGVGETGEICIRGPQVMKGYWNRPDETASSMRDGWLYTGDIAKMDEEGYFFIVERKKDMIITSGYNIYPREVEEVLYEHPAVLEAAAIGIPDAAKGERVKAFVVLKEGGSATEPEIIEYCKTKLAAYKVPRQIEFRKELPKSNIGKILRRVLREESAASSAPPPAAGA